MKKLIFVFFAIAIIAVLFTGCGKTDSVKNVQTLISDIGSNISLDSADAINAAIEAYDKLSDEEKEKVSNHKKLEAAIEKYDTLSGMNDYIANVIDAANTQFSKDDFNVADLIGKYDDMVDAYNDMKKADKEQIKDFDKLEEAIAKIKEYSDSASDPAATYARGFLEVYKDKGYTITKIGCIKQIRNDTEYHFFSLSYKDKNGEEHNVYSKARFAGSDVLGSILARPDIFYASEPASPETDCLTNGNVAIDLEATLKAAMALKVDIVAETTSAAKTTEKATQPAEETTAQ